MFEIVYLTVLVLSSYKMLLSMNYDISFKIFSIYSFTDKNINNTLKYFK